VNDKEQQSNLKPATVKPGDGADRAIDVLRFERSALRAISRRRASP